MRNSGKYFPYPVLSKETDDIKDSTLDFEYKIVKGKNLQCTVKAVLKNRTLKKLILEKKAAFITLIDCKKTRYRNVIKSTEDRYEFEIEEKLLMNEVQIASMIITLEDLGNYINSSFNEDYEGDSFYIKKNNILAYDEDITFNIERNTDSLENLPSIFVISENTETSAKSMTLDLTNTKIRVLLKSKEYGTYKVLRESQNCEEVLCSLFIVPALTNILSQFSNLEDDYGSSNWYHSIKTRLKDLGNYTSEEVQDNALSISQEILGNTFEKTLESLENMVIGADE